MLVVVEYIFFKFNAFIQLAHGYQHVGIVTHHIIPDIDGVGSNIPVGYDTLHRSNGSIVITVIEILDGQTVKQLGLVLIAAIQLHHLFGIAFQSIQITFERCHAGQASEFRDGTFAIVGSLALL